MKLTDRHIEALAQAERLMFHRDICGYLELRKLLEEDSDESRERLRALFIDYYQMGRFASPEFRNCFFKVMFSGFGIEKGKPNLPKILSHIHEKGHGFQASFVSKYVNLLDESSAIYDTHVRDLFGKRAPYSYKPISERVSWITQFLSDVRETYLLWAADKQVAPILIDCRARYPELQDIHVVRVMDFLVWKAGNLGSWKQPSAK